MNLTWKIKTEKYVNPHIGYIGEWKCFEYFYDSFIRKDSNLIYKLKCFLPGIKDDLGNYETEKQAKEKAQSVCDYWFSKLTNKG